MYGGKNCDGEGRNTERRECNPQPCPSKYSNPSNSSTIHNQYNIPPHPSIRRRIAGMGHLYDQSNISMGCYFYLQSLYQWVDKFCVPLYQWVLNLSPAFITLITLLWNIWLGQHFQRKYMNRYGFQRYRIYEWGVFWKSQRNVCTQKYRKRPLSATKDEMYLIQLARP
jgi:hypothetical protein